MPDEQPRRNTGKIIEIKGVVIDAVFPERLPEILTALEIEAPGRFGSTRLHARSFRRAARRGPDRSGKRCVPQAAKEPLRLPARVGSARVDDEYP